MYEAEQAAFVVLDIILATLTLSLVYLWGKRDRVSIRILGWIKEAAVRQVETPCTVFRHSMAFIGIAAGAMAFMHLMGMEPENWTKLILLSGFVGTALAAIHHQAAKTLFRRSDLLILKADAIETIPQPGVSPIVAIDDTAEFQNPDSRVVFTDRHLNPVQG